MGEQEAGEGAGTPVLERLWFPGAWLGPKMWDGVLMDLGGSPAGGDLGSACFTFCGARGQKTSATCPFRPGGLSESWDCGEGNSLGGGP